ncbi:hypothetical protein BDV59DRAFT_212029 [Aspergillus ambiguus]|uniref:uncharacterized protein n=1 Tax=Aspergillus ambiguus TaxID=176160 RepID=UPI003CCD6896
MNLCVRHLVPLSLQRSNSRTAIVLRPRKPVYLPPPFQTYLTSAVGRKHQETLAQLFRYTSGRWLWDKEQQLQGRYKTFNVPQLQTPIAQVIGSKGCDSITKLAERDFDKVFRLSMDDRKIILARIPNLNAGPAFYATASKVATKEFVRDVLQIPVPRILGWSSNPYNPAGPEYILMEEATGTQLATNHGSIYFASDTVDSAVPAQITSVAPSELKELISKKFTIGPSVMRDFWKKERSVMDISRGPWLSPEEYATSVCRRKPSHDVILVSAAQNDPRAHINLLEKYLNIVPCLMDVNPLLSSWAEPLFLQVQPSPLVDYQGSVLLKRPDNFDNLDPKQQLYLMETQKRNPILTKAFYLDHGKTSRQSDCPYRFTEDELRRHAVDAEGWNKVQDFFDSIESLVKRDGWIHPETFDAAFDFFSNFRKLGLKGMKGEERERERFDKQTSWARCQN